MKNTKTKFKINKKQKQTKQIGNKKKQKKTKIKKQKQNKTKAKHLITVKHIFFYFTHFYVLFSNKHKINNIKSNL
jgi:hypothetical protein